MQSTFSWEEPPANHSASPVSGLALLTRAEISRLSISESLNAISPAGAFGKMSPVSCHQTADGTLAPSSGRWRNSGMGGPTECWTLNTCEWTGLDGLFLNDDGVCSLSDILEPIGDVPQRYYLTARACAGVLRRAAKRGKALHPLLEAALMAVASREP